MKTVTKLLRVGTFLGAATLGSSLLLGQIVLLVDDVDPSHVTIAATGAFSHANNSGTTSFDGVDLLGFFTAPSPGLSLAFTSSLAPANGGYVLDSGTSDNVSPSLVDLNLSSSDPSANFVSQSFSKNSPAFGGVAFADLSGLPAGVLPALGATGDIVAGWSNNEGPILGQWVVVPEAPGAAWAGVFGVGMLSWALVRRSPKRG